MSKYPNSFGKILLSHLNIYSLYPSLSHFLKGIIFINHIYFSGHLQELICDVFYISHYPLLFFLDGGEWGKKTTYKPSLVLNSLSIPNITQFSVNAEKMNRRSIQKWLHVVVKHHIFHLFCICVGGKMRTQIKDETWNKQKLFIASRSTY